MFKTKIHTTLTPDLYQQLILVGEKSDTFSFFQSPVYFDLVEHIPNYNPILITAENDDREIIGSLLAIRISEKKGLKSKLSERIIVFGGSVTREERRERGEGREETESEVFKALLDGLNEVIGKVVLFTQFRNFYDTSSLKEIYAANGFIFRPRANLVVDCQDREKVWKGMSENRRRQLRRMGVEQDKRQKAKGKSGGSAFSSLPSPFFHTEAQSIDEVKSLYSILQDLYRHKVRKPLPPFEFFKYFFEKIHGTEWGKIFVVKYKDAVVGGIVCPITPGKTIYEMYICGKDKELKDKGVYPSVLATWAGIEYAIENNIPHFDFMGMGIPGRQYGVRDFKMRFGGRVVKYGRWTKINNPFLYHVAEFGYNVMAVLKRV